MVGDVLPNLVAADVDSEANALPLKKGFVA